MWKIWEYSKNIFFKCSKNLYFMLRIRWNCICFHTTSIMSLAFHTYFTKCIFCLTVSKIQANRISISTISFLKQCFLMSKNSRTAKFHFYKKIYYKMKIKNAWQNYLILFNMHESIIFDNSSLYLVQITLNKCKYYPL